MRITAGSHLCGTSGTTTCRAGTTCCGVTAETKDTDMTCSGVGNMCPVDRLSTVAYISVPYVYLSGGGSMGIIIGAAVGAVVVLGAIGAVIFCCLKNMKEKPQFQTTSNVVINNIEITTESHL